MTLQSKPSPSGSSSSSAAPRFKGAYRIWTPICRDDRAFASLLAWLTSGPHAADEVSLFTDFVHVVGKPLDEIAADARLLARRMAELRDGGIPSVGINVLGTISHGIHYGARHMPFAPGVHYDGRISRGPCPGDPALLAHQRQVYRLMAEAGPDFIWIDDDVRPIRGLCFCQRCLDGFGWTGTGEELVEQLEKPARIDLRRRWSRFGSEMLIELCRQMRAAVDEVDAGIEMGLMTVGHSNVHFTEYPISEMLAVLRGTKLRPGHGFYTDDRPRDILTKAIDAGRQVREAAGQARDILYELENWPYATLDKSNRSVAHESTLAAMVGCTGMAYNVLSERAVDFEDEYRPLAETLGRWQDVWDTIRAASADLPLRGFWPADRTRMLAHPKTNGGSWLRSSNGFNLHRPLPLAEMGLPLTVWPGEAQGTLLTGPIAAEFEDEELRDLLSTAVYMDHEALEVLDRRGLAELAGVRPGELVKHCHEMLTDHPINGRDAGMRRRAMHYRDYSFAMVPTSPATIELARIGMEVDDADAGLCMSAYENELGGRVVVAGYSPWEYLARVYKRRQLQEVATWMTHGRPAVRIDAPVRVVPLLRGGGPHERAVLCLLNVAMEPTPALPVSLDGEYASVVAMDPDGRVELDASPQEGRTSFRVAPIDTWQCRIVVASR